MNNLTSKEQATIIGEVVGERINQDVKWGVQNYNPFIYLAILGEEVGEANQAAIELGFAKGTVKEYRDELIQVAAVAIAAVECIDRNGDDWVKREALKR